MAWNWEGTAAVITGGGGLLGRGMALAFASAGADVMLADLRLEAAEQVAHEVEALGCRALPVRADVADPASMEALAARAFAEFGQVNLLCNNAGGARLKPYPELTLEDWSHVLGSNMMGVIHGVHAFLPRLIAQGGQRHIVNTSSMSGVGLASLRGLNAPYVVAKFAVVGLSETLRPVLAEHGIAVSVLCPGMTVADPHKPMEFRMASAAWYKDNLLSGAQVGEEVRHAVEENRLYVFPHRAGLGEVEQRHAAVLEGFRQAAATSPPMRPHAQG